MTLDLDFGFVGESDHTLDAKNRVVVPKRFQSELDAVDGGPPSVVLMRGVEDCVYLFSVSGFQAFKKFVKTDPFGSKKKRAVSRKLFSKTFLVQLDSTGRILVPEILKTCAGLTKEVVMVGVDERAEIWDRATWAAYEADHEQDFQDLDEVLGEEETPSGV